MCNEHIFPNGSFCELKIAKESHDLAKVLPQTTEQHFTDKDKVHRIQTLGNDNKDAMLDCESGFHQNEDKHKLNCHKLRSSYVTSI